MTWHLGLQRLRTVGLAALILGCIACLSVILTRALGYSPDPSVAQLFNALFPIGISSAILGALLLVAAWILAGFMNDHPR
jgi:hypothetical protein